MRDPCRVTWDGWCLRWTTPDGTARLAGDPQATREWVEASAEHQRKLTAEVPGHRWEVVPVRVTVEEVPTTDPPPAGEAPQASPHAACDA